MLIERSNLQLILAISEEGTISAAARRLGISPSLATRRIAAIENNLATRLFRRTAQQAFVTDAGKVVIAWAARTLRGEAEMLDALRDLRGEAQGHVRFACPEFLATRMLSGWLVEFADQHPQITLSVLAADRPVQLTKEHCDIGVHIGGSPHPDLVGRQINEFRMALFASKGYVAAHGAPQTPEELSQHRIIRSEFVKTDQWFLLDRKQEITTVPLNRMISSNSFVLSLELMRQGGGILMAANRTFNLGLLDDVLPVLPEYEPVLSDGEHYGLWMLFPDRHPLQCTRVFADALARHLQSLNGDPAAARQNLLSTWPQASAPS